MNRVVYQYYTLKMRKRKGGNLQISSTMVFFPLYFIMDSGYTNEVSVYKLYLLQLPIERCPGRTSQSLTRQLPQRGSHWRAGQARPKRERPFISETAAPCCHGQQQPDKAHCADAPALVSKARSFESYYTFSVQLISVRPANGSPYGRAGAPAPERAITPKYTACNKPLAYTTNPSRA